MAVLPSLSGCLTTTPRTKEEDRNASSILVCSLLDPRIEVLTLGITVFGNKSSNFEPNPRLNEAIDKEMQAALQSSRPDWKIASALGRKELDEKIVAFGRPGRYQFEQAQPELRAILDQSKVDLLFIVAPNSGDNVRIPGLSIEYQKDVAVPTISSRVYVLNRDLKVATQRALFTINFNDVVRPTVRVTTDLHAPGKSEDKQRAAQAAIDYGAKSVKSALRILGYGDA